MSEIVINNSRLIRKYRDGQPVITFEEIDIVHQRKPGSSRKNFTNNSFHFEENTDYYMVELSEYRDQYDRDFLRKGGNPNLKKVLLTATGYCLLAKTFNDDLSWKIQRALVANYFNLKESDGQPNMFDFLRQTIDLLEKQDDQIKELSARVEAIANLVGPRQLRLTFGDEPTEEKPPALLVEENPLNSTQIAAQLGLRSSTSQLPHQMLVKAIARQLGLAVDIRKDYEDDYVLTRCHREGNDGSLVITNVYKPLAIKMIKEFYEDIKDDAYFEEFYVKNGKKARVGELKCRGYKIGSRKYYIA